MAQCAYCRCFNRDSARFCRACGRNLLSARKKEPQRIRRLPNRRQEVEPMRARACPECSRANRPDATFCRHCGCVLSRPQPRRAPVEEPFIAALPRSVPEPEAPDLAGKGTWALPSILIGGGGLLALLGSFLPLASGEGESWSLVPHVTDHVQAALLLPVVGVLLAILAVGIRTAQTPVRSLLAGLAIALASPCAVLLWVFIDLANQASNALGWFAGQAGVGVGSLAMLLGYLTALAGGFLVLKE